ncbi:MAG: 37S ribosomal protein, mitochondrial [Alyxoria varia]|nr:MAG: 37S ribosomal protein, mitochondrial [Alyxoria varia]
MIIRQRLRRQILIAPARFVACSRRPARRWLATAENTTDPQTSTATADDYSALIKDAISSSNSQTPRNDEPSLSSQAQQEQEQEEEPGEVPPMPPHVQDHYVHKAIRTSRPPRRTTYSTPNVPFPTKTPHPFSVAQSNPQTNQTASPERTTGRYGSIRDPHYHPSTLLKSPPHANDLTLSLLLASQTHMGHSTSLWHPSNSRFIFGIREGVHIISLDATLAHLRRAARIVHSVAERAGIILFVGTRKGQDRYVVRAAQLAGPPACHLFERWIPGSITNGQQILGRCKRTVVDAQDIPVVGFEEELLEKPVLRPDLVVCLNPAENYVLLHECGLAGIPTIGVVDTDTNPTWVTYPIPANDDSVRSIGVIAGVLGRAAGEGRESRLALAEKGSVLYPRSRTLGPPEEKDKGKESAEEMLEREFDGWRDVPESVRRVELGLESPESVGLGVDGAGGDGSRGKVMAGDEVAMEEEEEEDSDEEEDDPMMKLAEDAHEEEAERQHSERQEAPLARRNQEQIEQEMENERSRVK